MLELTPSIQKAIKLSTKLHRNQFRKTDPNQPYVFHAFCVAWECANYVNDEDIIVAALMHDALEDTPEYSYEMLRNDFNENVAKIVLELTDEKDEYDNKIDTWDKRKQKEIDQISKLSKQALIVRCADVMNNIQQNIEDFKIMGNKFWDCFHAGKDKQIWFLTNVSKEIDKVLNNDMSKLLGKKLDEFLILVK